MKCCFPWTTMLFCLLFFSQTAFSQNKVHLEEDHTFKLKGEIVYKGKANEGFRLRELGRTLKVELPDSSIVELKRNLVLESKDYLDVLEDCYVFSESWATHRELNDEVRSCIIDTLKAGTKVLQKTAYHMNYKVKTASGIIGYVEAKCVMPNLHYVISAYRRTIYLYDIKDPVKEGLKIKTDSNGKHLTKTYLVRSGEKMIPIAQVGEYIKLRDLEGHEGWTEVIEVVEKGYTGHVSLPWLYRIMFNVSSWGEHGWFLGLLAILVYALFLCIYAFIPIWLVYQLVIRIKYMPNWICKLLIWALPLPFFFVTGLGLLYYPPFEYGMFWKIVVVLFVLAVVFMQLAMFAGSVSSERCPYWKCHAIGDYVVLDEQYSQHEEITTTTTTYSDGHKNVQKDKRLVTDVHTLKECNRCGTRWWC